MNLHNWSNFVTIIYKDHQSGGTNEDIFHMLVIHVPRILEHKERIIRITSHSQGIKVADKCTIHTCSTVL